MASSDTRVVCKRNVLIVGKTGAGKSTVANAIVNSDLFHVEHSVASVTNKTSHKEIVSREGEKEYNVKVIDTVGLFDTGARTNQDTIDEIKEYFKKHVPEGISLVLFVFKEGRFTPEERSTFEFVSKNFARDISDISALVVTNCDQMSEKARGRIVEDIRQNAVTKNMAQFVQKGIYAVGFPMRDDIDEDMRSFFDKKIKKDKQMLIDLVYKSGQMRLSNEIFDNSWWSNCTIL